MPNVEQARLHAAERLADLIDAAAPQDDAITLPAHAFPVIDAITEYVEIHLALAVARQYCPHRNDQPQLPAR